MRSQSAGATLAKGGAASPPASQALACVTGLGSLSGLALHTEGAGDVLRVGTASELGVLHMRACVWGGGGYGVGAAAAQSQGLEASEEG